MAMTPAAVPEDEQQSVIQFLTLDMRMCVVYGVQNVIPKYSKINWGEGVQRFKVGQTSMSYKHQSGRLFRDR